MPERSSQQQPAPLHPPAALERFAAFCLAAQPDDTRLGDLSEQYVRTHEGLRNRFRTAPWAISASDFAAGLRYVAATTNVMMFARAVEPSLRFAEDSSASLIALDLRERTMSMLRVAAHRLVFPALLLVCSALLVNSAIEVWRTWQQTETLMAQLQREKADAAAERIKSFIGAFESQVGWVAQAQWASLPVDQRRFDYVRLLRQVLPITQLMQLDRQGHEQLVVSRLSMDVVGKDTDRSAEPAFIEAIKNKVYFGPVYFRNNSEPYMTIAVAHGGRSGVTAAEVNLKAIWDGIKSVKVGETGYAYIVDGTGRLIAHPNEKLVLQGRNLSTLPQVAAAFAATSAAAEPVEGSTFEKEGTAEKVTSVHAAAIPFLNWRVFIDVPVEERQASLWSAIVRGISLLGLGIVTILFAVLLALRPITAVRPATA
jgi:hypothetical protein